MEWTNGRTHWASYGHGLSSNVRYLRGMRGLSQGRLAELAELSRNQVSNLERNENATNRSVDPMLSTVYKLARALHVPPAALLPASDRLVDGICKVGAPEVVLSWPLVEEDTQRFDMNHILNAEPGDFPSFDSCV